MKNLKATTKKNKHTKVLSKNRYYSNNSLIHTYHKKFNLNTTQKLKGNTIKIVNGKEKVIMIEKIKIEILLLFNILFNYYILLVFNHVDKNEIKNKLELLCYQMRDNNKLISKTTTDIHIKNIVNYLYTLFYQLLLLITKSLEDSQHKLKYNTEKDMNDKNQKKRKMKKHHKGGFYFKSLEEKGDKPITGADLTRLLDEMQQFFYNAKYTEEGKFLQDTDTLLSMLRGDLNQFKAILQYRIFPRYYTAFPPSINWTNIYNDVIVNKKWEDLPDYLLAYQSYLRSRDEYLVEKGLKPPSVLNKDLYTGFFNKMANSINDNIYAFQSARRYYQGTFFPISVPV